MQMFQNSTDLNSSLKDDISISVVCSSNQNRSMEAHNFLRYLS